MQDLVEAHINCPYCGEHLTVLADTSEIDQEYIEDCQVCCRPIIMMVNAEQTVAVRREDDVSFE